MKVLFWNLCSCKKKKLYNKLNSQKNFSCIKSQDPEECFSYSMRITNMIERQILPLLTRCNVCDCACFQCLVCLSIFNVIFFLEGSATPRPISVLVKAKNILHTLLYVDDMNINFIWNRQNLCVKDYIRLFMWAHLHAFSCMQLVLWQCVQTHA